MTEIDDLAATIRDGLNEDRKLAYEAGNGGPDTWIFNPELTWNSDNGPREAIVRFNGSALGYVAAVDPVHGKYGTWNARHIARHDPARVLAEIASKQALLDVLLAEPHWAICGARLHQPPCDCGRDRRVLRYLQHLAKPYQEQP